MKTPISVLLAEFKVRPIKELIINSFDFKPPVCLWYINYIFIILIFFSFQNVIISVLLYVLST